MTNLKDSHLLRILFSIHLIIVFGIYGNSQNAAIDSLKNLISQEQEMRKKINLIGEVVYLSTMVDYNQTELYLDSMQKLSKEIDYPYGIITQKLYAAIYNENLGLYKENIAICNEIEQLIEIYRDSFSSEYIEDYLHDVSMLKSRNFDATGQKDSCIVILYDRLEFLKNKPSNTLNDERSVEVLRSLSVIYSDSNPILALEYIDRAIALGRKTNQNLIAEFTSRIEILQNNESPRNVLKNTIDSMIHYSHLSVDKWWLMHSLLYKTEYFLEEDLNLANQYLLESDSLNEFFNTPLIRSLSYYYHGRIAEEKNDHRRAEKMFKLALDDHMRNAEYDNLIMVFDELYDNLRKQNKHNQAAELGREYIDTLKSFFDMRVKTKFLEAEAQYQTAEKERQLAVKELELIQKDTQRNLIIGVGLIVLILLASIFSWYFNRQKRKKIIAELALDLEKKEALRLRELDDMKMQFFTNVSHELKTPLTLVLGPLTQALEKISDSEVNKNVVTAYNNAERINELINETLDFRKLEKGSVVINNTISCIAEDLRRMFFGFSSLAEIRDIGQQEKVEIGDDIYLDIDIGKLEKIVNNLISNALKFSNNGSDIKMVAHYKEGILEIAIQDYGKGIDLSEQDKIFNRFYQAKHNLEGNYGGTGVGLAFSKQLAEILDGTLTVLSKPSEGSTFILRIPAKQKTGYSKEQETIKEQDVTLKDVYVPILINGHRPEVLIVEDNREMQDYLKSILEKDYRCHFANDGYEAVKMVQTKQFHLISSDVMMPNMDGFKLKEKINDIPQARSIPFIFLTARSLEEDKLVGLRLGVDDYISKPFNKDEYQARVYNLLKNYNERIDGGDINTQFKYTESVDEGKLKEAERKVLENLSNPNFKVNELAEHLHYSQRQLSRVIKQMTGMTPVGFILELRLQRAYHLIKFKAYESVSEVRYEVGIESSSYFSRKFKERFGINPSEV